MLLCECCCSWSQRLSYEGLTLKVVEHARLFFSIKCPLHIVCTSTGNDSGQVFACRTGGWWGNDKLSSASWALTQTGRRNVRKNCQEMPSHGIWASWLWDLLFYYLYLEINKLYLSTMHRGKIHNECFFDVFQVDPVIELCFALLNPGCSVAGVSSGHRTHHRSFNESFNETIARCHVSSWLLTYIPMLSMWTLHL